MTKFESARTAGRWRPRSRTYVALAILFVTAWPTNADVFHDAFHVSARYVRCFLPQSSSEPDLHEQRGDADAEQHKQAKDVAPPQRLPITQQDKNDPPT